MDATLRPTKCGNNKGSICCEWYTSNRKLSIFHKGPKKGYYPCEINHQNEWHFPIVGNQRTEPLAVSTYNFLQFSTLIHSYFEHIFASGKPKNDRKSMHMISNVSL